MFTNHRKLIAAVAVGSLSAALALGQTKPVVDQAARDIFFKPELAQEEHLQPGDNGETTGGEQAADNAVVSLHYQILLREGQTDKFTIVADDHEFKSGDQFRVRFKSSVDAYGYIFNRGSSTRGVVLFPDERINDGKNQLPGGKQACVPASGWFEFDEKPGAEKLVIFVSTKPIKELEKASASRSIESKLWDHAVEPVIKKREHSVLAGRTKDIIYVDVPEEPEVQTGGGSDEQTDGGGGGQTDDPGAENQQDENAETGGQGAETTTPAESEPGTYLTTVTIDGQALLIHTIELKHK